MTGTHDTTILVIGRMNPHVVERIDRTFRMERMEIGDPALVTPELAALVRGIAASGAVSAQFMDALPNLEIIANFGVGYDNVDAVHAGKAGIMVTNTPDVLTEEVADTALGLLIDTVRELPQAQAWLKAGKWEREGNYPLTKLSLRGRTVGIFGLGRIGKAIARRIEAFGLPIAYHNRHQDNEVAYDYYPSLPALAEAVDTLIVAVPGGLGTEKAVNAQVLGALGANGVLINIGRGTVVDEEALIEALGNGTIAAAGLDVFADEPHVPQALIDLPNATLLPHVASASQATRRAMADLVVDNLIAWFEDGVALTPVPQTAGVKRRG
ncbi:2-hydroxyacid dehydrogenase [Phyllobacterium leguminum]|uniref:Lactate dehydrogenase-like 2-hydroxyacid dehydrogenase n=1 Tax=Phyllobacterium leguminum TaxID=314237 RepID=A0A318T477_9HYPH|nr:2-hydroxyacid dehydrogenase [Phyllobacterium leguminum]PYE88813.1 lactate dehydrogenase-like 2-hydroxyacid dehydrogenase [Phyllobacterium leguminum]